MKKKENLKFEEAIQELEEIAEKLEKGQISLEESILAYERGIELKNICIHRLQEAESKIEILSKSQDGTVRKEPVPRNSSDSPFDHSMQEELF